MRGRGRFAVLAVVAVAIYGLAAWLFLLPSVRLPPAQTHAGSSPPACADRESLDRLREQQVILFVPLEQIPDHVVAPLLQQEDAFYHHRGVDWEQLVRAFWQNLFAREYRYGASTLTMQLVRELFLGRERTLLRKLREIAYALQAERRLGKDEILELYLNVVHWGPGVRGIGSASCYYFGVPPSLLDTDEAARLVAVLPNPDRLGLALQEWARARQAAPARRLWSHR